MSSDFNFLVFIAWTQQNPSRPRTDCVRNLIDPYSASGMLLQDCYSWRHSVIEATKYSMTAETDIDLTQKLMTGRWLSTLWRTEALHVTVMYMIVI